MLKTDVNKLKIKTKVDSVDSVESEENVESVETMEMVESVDKSASIMQVSTGYHAGIYGVSCRYLRGIMREAWLCIEVKDEAQN